MPLFQSCRKLAVKPEDDLSPESPLANSQKDIIELMFPVYFFGSIERLVEDDYVAARGSWAFFSISAAGEAQPNSNSDQEESCPDARKLSVEDFCSTFFERYNDVHQYSQNKVFLPSSKIRTSCLVRLIDFVINRPLATEETHQAMLDNFRGWHSRGMRSSDFGNVGTVLFWTLRRCLGVSVYNGDIHGSWVRIYSNLLAILVPVTVHHELSILSKRRRLSLSNRRSGGDPNSDGNEPLRAAANITSEELKAREMESKRRRRSSGSTYIINAAKLAAAAFAGVPFTDEQENDDRPVSSTAARNSSGILEYFAVTLGNNIVHPDKADRNGRTPGHSEEGHPRKVLHCHKQREKIQSTRMTPEYDMPPMLESIIESESSDSALSSIYAHADDHGRLNADRGKRGC